MYGHYKFGLRFIAGYCDLYFKFQWSISMYLLEKDIQIATVEYTGTKHLRHHRHNFHT